MIGLEPRGPGRLLGTLGPSLPDIESRIIWLCGTVSVFFFFCALQLKEGNRKSPEEISTWIGERDGSYIRSGEGALHKRGEICAMT